MRVAERAEGILDRLVVTCILNLWMKHPDGRISAEHEEYPLMYSTSTPYTDIKSVRAALTAFATQLVRKELVREAEVAVDPEHGLHASRKATRTTTKQQVQWADISGATIPHLVELTRANQPLTWRLVRAIAFRESLQLWHSVSSRCCQNEHSGDDDPNINEWTKISRVVIRL